MSSPHRLDARGLLCPIPVIRAQEMAKHLPDNAVVQVVGTDPGVMYDIPAWCRIHGHQVLSSSNNGDEYHIEFQICTSG